MGSSGTRSASKRNSGENGGVTTRSKGKGKRSKGKEIYTAQDLLSVQDILDCAGYIAVVRQSCFCVRNVFRPFFIR